ncbi:MAG: glycoside hydrolase family 127 protein [Planctomycetales bacterium]|nr:glycoside hydrolase family 127 protein [Planctomycetales bacterium]
MKHAIDFPPRRLQQFLLLAAGIAASLPVILSAAVSSAETVVPFGVQDVRLLDGPFKQAQDADAAYLLTLKPDRLLSWYRKEAGLEPKAEVYGGWESMGVAGHCLGHYLSACARMYHATGNVEFRNRVDYIVAQLAECQEAGGDGFVGAMPRGREVFAEVSRGDIRSAGFDLNGCWVPWYTLHKELAGLIDAYRLCGNDQAKDVAMRLGDWAVEITKNLTPRQWQQMLACEHGGMNESMAELYELTGDEQFLELAKKFYHRAILDPLAAERDELAGKHSNTQIPKVIGAAKIAELTGDEKFATIARFFWTTVVNNHSYVTGGNSLGEHLGPPGKLNDRLGPSTTETCNTYNMLKLTSALFAEEPAGRYADYAERALWNHILASQNRATGMVCYFVPLAAGSTKPFMGPEDFTCCSGSGMENHVRYAEYIYAHGESDLYVNQYISSTLDWQDAGVKVRQESQLPNKGATRLTISCQGTPEGTLHLRRPGWCESGFRVLVNGTPIETAAQPGEYAAIKRTWRDGDVVDVDFPLALRLERMPDNPNRVAVFRGPVLYVGLVDSNEPAMLPVLVTGGRPPAEWLKPAGGEPPRFMTDGVGRPVDVPLEPFFAVSNDWYIVYWDVFTETQWQDRQREYEAAQKREQELAARTVDLFAIGEMQAERDHSVEGEKTGPGDFGGRKFRHAWDGGWFQFDIALPEEGPADMIVTYWGSETGARSFDVLLDGQKLATESLHQDDPDKFWERTYALPQDQTAGKTHAAVKFQAHPGNYAGGVFGVRVVRRSSAEPQSP